MGMKQHRGFALIIVLWLIAVLSFGAVWILQNGRNELEIAKQLNQKLIAELDATSMGALVHYIAVGAKRDSLYLENPNLEEMNLSHPVALPQMLAFDGREYNLSEYISIALHDSAAFINVTVGNPSMLSRVASDGAVARDSIQDWLDYDDFEHLNGAERSFYEYREIGNRAFLTHPEELLLIRGIREHKAYYGMPFEKVYGQSRRFNLNPMIMHPELLKMLFNIEEGDWELLEKIKAIKNNDDRVNQLQGFLNARAKLSEEFSFVGHGAYKIVVKVHYNSARTEIMYYSDFNIDENETITIWNYK